MFYYIFFRLKALIVGFKERTRVIKKQSFYGRDRGFVADGGFFFF